MLKRNVILGLTTVLVVAAAAAQASAQEAAPRFGRWQMDQDNPPPAINIMTYEAYGDGGMKITVASTNSRGQSSEWGYVTMFDGEFRPVSGQDGSQTAVEFVNDKTTRISNMRNGRVTQVIMNTLSDDGNVINNEYVRMDEDGKITGVSHAVYRRMR